MLFYYRFFRRACVTAGSINVSAPNVKGALLVGGALGGLMCCSVWDMGTLFSIHIAVTAGLVALVDLVVRAIKKERAETAVDRLPIDRRPRAERGPGVWRTICGSGIIPLAATCALMLFGYINMNNVVYTGCTVYTDKSIRAEGYSVALIADVHFGVSVDKDGLLRICDEVSAKKPDIVVLCGDIVDENTTKQGMRDVFSALGGIESEFGVFYVYGNHDRQLYTDDKSYTQNELADAITANGIRILRDEAYSVNDEFVIIGREDRSYAAVGGERASIEKLISGVDKNKFILTLDHQPTEYEENGKAGTDLLLSGHTHGGQIFPLDLVFELFNMNDALYGYTRIDGDTQAFVTSGLAGWGYPVKTVGKAEYAVIDILPRPSR